MRVDRNPVHAEVNCGLDQLGPGDVGVPKTLHSLQQFSTFHILSSRVGGEGGCNIIGTKEHAVVFSKSPNA